VLIHGASSFGLSAVSLDLHHESEIDTVIAAGSSCLAFASPPDERKGTTFRAMLEEFPRGDPHLPHLEW
jgi:hypothetical protein